MPTTPSRAPKAPPPTTTLLPFRRILLQTLAVGFLMALAAGIGKRGDFALGAVVGSILACIGLVHLKVALSKVLTGSEGGTQKSFLTASALRWVLWGIAFLILVKISVVCLLGAAGAYLGYLLLLAWNGLRAPHPPAADEGSPTGRV